MNRLKLLGALEFLFLTMAGSAWVLVDVHICGDTIQDMAVYQSAEKCSSMSGSSSCTDQPSDEPSFSKKPCCAQETLFFTCSFESHHQLVYSFDQELNSISSDQENYDLFPAHNNVPSTEIDKPPPNRKYLKLNILFETYLI